MNCVLLKLCAVVNCINCSVFEILPINVKFVLYG